VRRGAASSSLACRVQAASDASRRAAAAAAGYSGREKLTTLNILLEIPGPDRFQGPERGFRGNLGAGPGPLERRIDASTRRGRFRVSEQDTPLGRGPLLPSRNFL
jgi:hypothetical protein